MHGKNTIASSVIRRRAAEALARAGIKIADIIWPDESAAQDKGGGLSVLAKDALWNGVIMDLRKIVPNYQPSLCRAVNFLTRSRLTLSANPTAHDIASALGRSSHARHNSLK
eukprot:2983892-Amphidinium_carterae.1